MTNDDEELVALFRYSVISEAVGTRRSPAERGLIVRSLASRSWTTPKGEEHHYSRSTIDRWITDYHRDGLAGLRPVPRADKGRGRVSPELMAEASPSCGPDAVGRSDRRHHRPSTRGDPLRAHHARSPRPLGCEPQSPHC